MTAITVEQSGAFVERFTVAPTGQGPLDGLAFAVKDLIDVAGRRTGCGNPTWRETHPPASVSAVCVEQLLAGGARCEGKTVTDEVAFSLLGENHFYGTPLNPATPDRVPGGSSSGSASAVACGLVDFALGTDSGGSVRVPASNCGIWGWRPSHGLVSVAGVMPFTPTFDSVGILARSADILWRAVDVLVPVEPAPAAAPRTIHLVTEAFALADAEVRDALAPAIHWMRKRFGGAVRETSLGELCCDSQAAAMDTWLDTYRVLMATEVKSSLGGWIAEIGPTFGPATSAGFEFVNGIDRTRVGEAIGRRESYCSKLRRALGSHDLLCLPTAATTAPARGTTNYGRYGDYYQRTLSLTSIAGVGRLPQVSMPLGNVGPAPIGLSLAGAYGEDLFLVETAAQIEREWNES